MVTQKELKGRYMSIICSEVWPDSNEMQKYADKKFNYAVELNNDDIFVIDKPYIKKDFCFGYGWCGSSTEEDEERAGRAADYASTDEHYFIKENLKDIEDKIDRLKDPRFKGYKYCMYSGQPSGSKLKTYTLCYDWDDPNHDVLRWERLTDVEKLTQEEIKALIAGYEVVKEMFTKRLRTYLKKYGLTKINTWTYLRD